MLGARESASKYPPASPIGFYYAFVLLLIWLPLPMGSNRPWAWAIMEIYLLVLAMFWLVNYNMERVRLTRAFKAATPVLLIYGVWLVYILLQCTPLPLEFVAAISPKAAENYLAIPGPTPEQIHISLDPHATWTGLQKSFAYFLIFCFSLLLLDNRTRVKIMLLVIIISGFAQAVYGVVMTLSGLEWGFFVKKVYSIGVASGTFVNRNHFANFLMMSLSVGVGWMIYKTSPGEGEKTRKQHILAAIQWVLSGKISMRLVLVAIVIGLVMTRSRMGNFSFFLSLITAGGLMWHFSGKSKWKLLALFVSLVIVDIYVMGTWFGIERVVERIQQTSSATEMRPEMVAGSIMLWKDYLWVGSGLETFYTTFPAYKTAGMTGYVDHAHNDFIELLAEVGIIGFALMLPVVGLSFLVGLNAMRTTSSRLMRGVAFASVMAIIAQLLHASVDFSLRIPANAAYMMVFLAMAWVGRTGLRN